MIRLACDGAVAEFDEVGAEPKRWLARGKDRLWTPDPRFWPDIAPNMFPICGWARGSEIRVDGAAYPMDVHGFAQHQRFEVLSTDTAHAHLRLSDTTETRLHYPFAFQFDIEYRLTAEALRCQLSVTNLDKSPLPYALGVHPGFATGSLEENAWSVEFDEEENPTVPLIASGGVFSSQTKAVPLEGRRLRLTSELFAGGALCFLNARSRGLVLRREDGEGIRIELEGMPHIVLWTKPGAPYVCVEGWTGYGDPEGFDGDIREKPGMQFLKPGQSATHVAVYAVV